MDLQTAVAASMLPGSRSRVASACRELRHDPATGAAFLEVLWTTSGHSGRVSPAESARLLSASSTMLALAARLAIEPIPLFDPRYPALLACVTDPPPVLWASGDLQTVECPAVAVIGSRAATPYALQVATRIAAELAGRGIVVVSGLARGVDSAAHRGCLEGGGRTVAVQGCGLDRVYPPEHEELASRIRAQGVLLSELGPGAPPLPEHFPLRNRIISGLSLATVVVEASEQSGSLITARYATEQGRDVMAVPGSVLSGRNRGSHALLKDGARIVETADDVLQELGWPQVAPAPVQSRKALDTEPLLEKMLPGERYAVDELASLTGMTGPKLLARLTELELAGVVSVTAGRFGRIR